MGKIIKVKYKGNYCTDSKLGDYEINNINKELMEFDWFIYCYGTAPYEGDGVSVHKKDGKYYQSNLGHCSCYEPTDNIETKTGFNTIEDLLKKCSDGLKKELEPVLNKIKEIDGKS